MPVMKESRDTKIEELYMDLNCGVDLKAFLKECDEELAISMKERSDELVKLYEAYSIC